MGVYHSKVLSRPLFDNFTEVLDLLLDDWLHDGLHMLNRLDSYWLVDMDINVLRHWNVTGLLNVTRNSTRHTHFDGHWLIHMNRDGNRLWNIHNSLDGTGNLYLTCNMTRHRVMHVYRNRNVHDALEGLVNGYVDVVGDLALFNHRHRIRALDTDFTLDRNVNDLFHWNLANLLDRLDFNLRDMYLANYRLVDNLDLGDFTDNFLDLRNVNDPFDGLDLWDLNNLVFVLNFNAGNLSDNLLHFNFRHMTDNFLNLHNLLNSLLNLHLWNLDDALDGLNFDSRDFANDFLDLNLWDVSLNCLDLWDLDNSVTDLNRLNHWHVLHDVLSDRFVLEDGRLLHHVLLALCQNWLLNNRCHAVMVTLDQRWLLHKVRHATELTRHRLVHHVWMSVIYSGRLLNVVDDWFCGR